MIPLQVSQVNKTRPSLCLKHVICKLNCSAIWCRVYVHVQCHRTFSFFNFVLQCRHETQHDVSIQDVCLIVERMCV